MTTIPGVLKVRPPPENVSCTSWRNFFTAAASQGPAPWLDRRQWWRKGPSRPQPEDVSRLQNGRFASDAAVR